MSDRQAALETSAGPDEFIMKALDGWVRAGLEGLAGREGERPGSIEELHIELTHRCNLRCVMCHHWEQPFRDPGSVKREMDLAAIRRLVDGAEKLKDVKIIVLTGGEPMIRSDIGDILSFLAGRYPAASIGVLTNFWNTELVRRRLAEWRSRGLLGRLWLGSSLDGVGAAHDEVRGQEGAFEGLVKTTALMRREFPEVSFSFSFTITPRNYRELWPTYQFVSREGLWFGAQMVVNHQELEAPETYEWKAEELGEVERQIDLILADLAGREGALQRIVSGQERQALWLWTRLLYWRYLRKYARRPERFFKDCMAGSRYAMFDPEGNLFFCPVNKHRTVGNALDQKFDAVWTSAKADEERRYVDSCRCDCWLNCIANPILDRVVAEGLGGGGPGSG